MKNKIKHHSGNIFIAQYGPHIDVDSIQKNLIFLADNGVCTFGNISTDILRPILEDEGFIIENNDLCFQDDLTIGLQMPDTWYLNRSAAAISISMYYNFLNFKEMAKGGVLFTKNKEAFDHFGRTGIIEVYMQNTLEDFLTSNYIDYFGVPKTLTECMRVLEGWDIKRVPRLKTYVPYSEFIKLWCKDFYPYFNDSEWGLGEDKSKILLDASGTTNVREAIKYFWQNYLRNKKISLGDVEIDILSRLFYEKRKPDFIFIGEDIFTQSDSSNLVSFKEFTSGKIITASRSQEKNDKDISTALLAQKLFPNSKIIIFRNMPSMPNFTMCKLDEIKNGVNREVGVIAEVLSFFLKNPNF